MKKIIANHAHVFQKEVMEHGTIDCLKSVLDECNIDAAVCFAPFACDFISNGESQNRWLYESIKNEDSLYGFGTIDFSKDDLKSQVEEIHSLGLQGIKMHPAYQKFKVDGERACEVYEIAQKYNLPISFHTGIHWHRIASYNTLLYDEVVQKFPELRICMEHVGGYSFFNEAVAVMCNNPGKVYAGLTSVFHHDTHKHWYLGKEKVKDLIWLTGVEQSIFGLDFPYTKAYQLKEAINCIKECVTEMNLGEDDLYKILGGNLLRMIHKE